MEIQFPNLFEDENLSDLMMMRCLASAYLINKNLFTLLRRYAIKTNFE